MHSAAFDGQHEVVRILAARGVDPDGLLKKDGFSPLHRACWGQSPGHTETVKALLLAGAEPARKSRDGRDCLMMTKNVNVTNLFRIWNNPSIDVPGIMASALHTFAGRQDAPEKAAADLRRCLPKKGFEIFAFGVREALEQVKSKNKGEAREGLVQLAEQTAALAQEAAEPPLPVDEQGRICDGSSYSGAMDMVAAARRLALSASVDTQVDWEYRRRFVVGGINAHEETRAVMMNWNSPGVLGASQTVGVALGRLCKLFATKTDGRQHSEL